MASGLRRHELPLLDAGVAGDVVVDLEVELLLFIHHIGDKARFAGLLQRLLEGGLEGGAVEPTVGRLVLSWRHPWAIELLIPVVRRAVLSVYL